MRDLGIEGVPGEAGNGGRRCPSEKAPPAPDLVERRFVSESQDQLWLVDLTGVLEAERHSRKIIGYLNLATLVVAIERDHDNRRQSDAARTPTQEATILVNA